MLCVDMQIAKMIHKPNNDEFTWSVDAATEQMIMDTMRAHQPGWIVWNFCSENERIDHPLTLVVFAHWILKHMV